MESPGILIFQISDFMELHGYLIAGYGNVCMPDDSNKALGMLFESEAWPLPFESNKIPVLEYVKILTLTLISNLLEVSMFLVSYCSVVIA